VLAVAAKEFQPRILDFVNAKTLSKMMCRMRFYTPVIRVYDEAGNVN
jgi:hypothetical protein